MKIIKEDSIRDLIIKRLLGDYTNYLHNERNRGWLYALSDDALLREYVKAVS
jgi:hypothetical protein